MIARLKPFEAPNGQKQRPHAVPLTLQDIRTASFPDGNCGWGVRVSAGPPYTLTPCAPPVSWRGRKPVLPPLVFLPDVVVSLVEHEGWDGPRWKVEGHWNLAGAWRLRASEVKPRKLRTEMKEASKDSLGDRMKLLEGREAQRRALPRLPIVIRIDGKGFSKWTSGLRRPFDERLEGLRQCTTQALVEQLGAAIGYHQSDEISLILFTDNCKAQLYADGRFQKIVSHSASIATAVWNANVKEHIPEKARSLAFFDARAWEVPSEAEAVNAILWREQDAVKNSIQMLARSHFSHKECHGKNGAELQDMLHQIGVNWNDCPDWAKRGTYVGRVSYSRVLTPLEIEALPPNHNARKNPELPVARSQVQVRPMPPLGTVINRADVLLRGADPITKQIDG